MDISTGMAATIPDRESVVVSVGSIDPADAKAKPVNDASSELVEPVINKTRLMLVTGETRPLC